MSDSDFIPTREPNERVFHLTESERRVVLFGGEPYLLEQVTIRNYPNVEMTDDVSLYGRPIGRNGQVKRNGRCRLIWGVIDASDSIHAVL